MRHGKSSVLHFLLLLRKGIPKVKTRTVRKFCENMGWWNGRFQVQDFFDPDLVPMPSDEFMRMARDKKWLGQLLERAEDNGGVIGEPDFEACIPSAITRNHIKHPEYAVYSAFELFLWFWTAETTSHFVVAFDSDTYFPTNIKHYLPPDKGWVYYRRCTDQALKAAVRKEFLAYYLRLVRNVAGRMAIKFPRSVELSDLINAGTIGLIQAFDNFDPTRGIKFSSYAVPRIRGAILDELRMLDWVPRSVRSNNRQIDDAILKLTLEMSNHVRPGLIEAADRLGITPRELSHRLWDRDLGGILSLDEVVYPEDDNRQIPRIEQVASDHDVTPTEYIRQQTVIDAFEDMLLQLTTQQQKVIHLYYWWEMTLKQIGGIMRISESRVSQIHTKALSRLREMCCKKFGITYVVQENGDVKYFDVPVAEAPPVPL